MMTAPRISRSARMLVALALVAAAAASLSARTHAQDLPAPGDGFVWERVGDRGLDLFDLAFGPDGTLWATGTDGPYRLDLSGGFPGVWVRIIHSGIYYGSILPLGRGPQGDTLLVSRTGRTWRSVDGGQTWAQVHDRGGGGLYEVPEGYPYAGRILVSAADGFAASIAYSDDRGATFTEGTVPGPGGNYAHAEDFAALPPGSPHAGRLLAAGRWGVNISDDGGVTWRESGLWQVLYYVGERIGAVEQPDLDEGIGPARSAVGTGGVMGGFVNAQPLARAWASADDGETWLPEGGGQALPEGPPNLTWGVKGVLSLGGPSALVVLHKGTVYRTDDGGRTWAAIGRAPDVGTAGISVRAAALGPDGRLYVGLLDTSAARGWVWRTAEQVTLAPVTVSVASPGRAVVVPAGGGAFSFQVVLTNAGAEAEAVVLRTGVHLPDGTGVGPLLEHTVEVPAGGQVVLALTQAVPGAAPPGRYRYVAFTGQWPEPLGASDEFGFVKLGAGAREAASAAWPSPVVAVEEGASASALGPGEGLALVVRPNPARGAATVALTLPEAGEVAVSVYDVLGRRVAVLHAGRLGAGEHALALDGATLPAGVYVVRVEAGGLTASRTVTVLR